MAWAMLSISGTTHAQFAEGLHFSMLMCEPEWAVARIDLHTRVCLHLSQLLLGDLHTRVVYSI